jgi:putative membrane protein
MMWWGNDYWPMSWAVGPFMLIVVVVLFVAVMLFMVRGMPGGHRDENGVALDILKERFARGEITQAEFEEKRRFLEAA